LIAEHPSQEQKPGAHDKKELVRIFLALFPILDFRSKVFLFEVVFEALVFFFRQ